MPPSAWEGLGDVRRARGSGAHTLLAGDADQVRASTAEWVGHELSGGAKVLYKGWFGDDREPVGHWLFGPGGVPAAPAALGCGQLELLDFRTVVERCGGSTEGLFRWQSHEVRTAVTAGWTSVAMTQESTHRPLADGREAAEFVEQEQGYGRLAERWPLNTLCQLTVAEERPAAVRASVAVHHGDVAAGGWSARTEDGRWHLSGDLDVAVASEFGAAVEGAFRAVAGRLHVDLGSVSFLDSACAQVLLLAARSAPRRRRLVLHRASEVVRELLAAVGLPRWVHVEVGGAS